MKQLDIKIYKQETSYSCCAAVLQSLVWFLGSEIDHAGAIKLTKCDENDGSSFKMIAFICKKLFKTKYKTLRSVKEVCRYIDLGYPVLMEDNYTYVDSHATLIVGYDEKNFAVFDPNTGKINFKDKKFVFKQSDENIVIYKD
jgi:ABC-type bacteriocin/lantibiotic exporter with double-glycine peptidase domain